MEIVINRCYGGFGLSKEACELCIKRGMTVAKFQEKGDRIADFVIYPDEEYCIRDDHHVRTNKILIEVIKELGDKANGDYAALKIITIPFDDLNAFEIKSFDGKESVIPYPICSSYY